MPIVASIVYAFYDSHQHRLQMRMRFKNIRFGTGEQSKGIDSTGLDHLREERIGNLESTSYLLRLASETSSTE